jgi:hypothetical protein
MQTFEEALQYGLDEGLGLVRTDEHPLTVGCYHICSVCEHPVEATAAGYYVLACRVVENVYHIVAVSSGESVLHSGGVEFATHHEVVTFLGHQIVEAKTALNGIVASPSGGPSGMATRGSGDQHGRLGRKTGRGFFDYGV